MTYLGQDNDFINSSYSLTLFEAYLRHLFGALPACNAFLLPRNFADFHAVWIVLNLLKYVPFYSHSMHALAIILIFDQQLARTSDINFKLKNFN